MSLLLEIFYKVRTKIAASHYNGYKSLFLVFVTLVIFGPFGYLCLVNIDYLVNNFHGFLIELGLEDAPIIPEPEPIVVEPVLESEGFTTTEIIVISVVVIGAVVICGSVCGFLIFI
jgi:hypothetical protein